MIGRLALAAILLLGLSGCREDFFDPTPGQTGPAQKIVEVIAENVRVLPGDANAVRIGFRPKDVAVHIRVERSSSDGRIVACPLRAIDDPLPPPASCLPDLPNGVRESLTLTGLGGVALVREGDPVTLGIRMDYEEGGRELTFRFPIVERPAGASVCKDNACNPFFEVRPVQGGPLRATARWTGGTARLEVLEGRVLARSFSSTGIPYRIAAQREGASPVSVAATLGAPSEYALAFLNTGPGNITGVTISTSWP